MEREDRLFGRIAAARRRPQADATLYIRSVSGDLLVEAEGERIGWTLEFVLVLRRAELCVRLGRSDRGHDRRGVRLHVRDRAKHAARRICEEADGRFRRDDRGWAVSSA